MIIQETARRKTRLVSVLSNGKPPQKKKRTRSKSNVTTSSRGGVSPPRPSRPKNYTDNIKMKSKIKRDNRSATPDGRGRRTKQYPPNPRPPPRHASPRHVY